MERCTLLLAGALLGLGCSEGARDSAAQPPGTLTLHSVPPGAQVVLDGVPVGATPHRLDLPAGELTRPPRHRVTLTMDGKPSWSQTLHLLPGVAQELTVYLDQAPAQAALDDDEEAEPVADVALSVVGSNGLRVEIDGRPLDGRTPLREVPLAPGTHEVRLLDAQGHRHAYRVELLAPGPAVLTIASPGAPPRGNAAVREPSYLGCSDCPPAADDSESAAAPAREPLPRGQVELAINTSPPARVVVDGKDSGLLTPVFPSKALRLSAGEHELRFRTQDGATFLYRVTLREGELNKLLLKPLGGPAGGNVDAEPLGGSGR
jgi:hypothetical protein